MIPSAPRERLIVALDFPTLAEAETMIGRLGDTVSFYKIGLELIYAGGLPLVRRLVGDGKQVFLDAKLLDIDNTVAGAVGTIRSLGVTLLTIHAYPRAMRAAVAARGDSGVKLLGVTVLTSMDGDDLTDAGYSGSVQDLVLRRALDAKAAGMDGLIAAPGETAAIRTAVGPDMLIVTPGIRPRGTDAGDQKRIATPAEAIVGGADHLVVGRAITGAADPLAAASAIVAEIASAAGDSG
ncbi:MAG: orotidine-5'-phosphate decarboxylase [Alphaproteobacteria bacterium]